MFADGDFWHAVVNTVAISLLQLIFYFPVPLGLALLLHSLTSTTVKRLVKNVVYLPHFISWVIVVALFQQILGGAGVVNGFLADHGMHTVDIIGNPDAFKPLLIAQVIWKDSGWGTIIFLAALAQVDDSLYEASAMDGAGPWRRFWHVTMPCIRQVIVLLLLLRLGEVLSVGFEQLLLQRDAVGPAAGEIIDTYVYNKSLGGGGDFPLAAAAGIFKGVAGRHGDQRQARRRQRRQGRRDQLRHPARAEGDQQVPPGGQRGARHRPAADRRPRRRLPGQDGHPDGRRRPARHHEHRRRLHPAARGGLRRQQVRRPVGVPGRRRRQGVPQPGQHPHAGVEGHGPGQGPDHGRAGRAARAGQHHVRQPGDVEGRRRRRRGLRRGHLDQRRPAHTTPRRSSSRPWRSCATSTRPASTTRTR